MNVAVELLQLQTIRELQLISRGYPQKWISLISYMLYVICYMLYIMSPLRQPGAVKWMWRMFT